MEAPRLRAGWAQASAQGRRMRAWSRTEGCWGRAPPGDAGRRTEGSGHIARTWEVRAAPEGRSSGPHSVSGHDRAETSGRWAFRGLTSRSHDFLTTGERPAQAAPYIARGPAYRDAEVEM